MFKELLQQKENHINKGDYVKMNQAQENLAISVSSSKQSDEVDNLQQKMKEMEVPHAEQINYHMKRTNEATVSLMQERNFNEFIAFSYYLVQVDGN